MAHRVRAVCVAVVAVVAVAPPAAASELIDRNATDVKLEVSREGYALLTYRVRGAVRRVLSWSAVNAIAPTPARRQVEFRLDYSGGWGAFKRDVWKNFPDACRPYDGPKLHWLVTACKAADGSYWAVQSWQRALPNYGVRPTAKQEAWELRLSHWTGDLPVLDIRLNWSYRRFDHLFGTFRYLGRAIHGFKSTPQGVPLDSFGRNIYLDTFNSAYGRGWKRENSFLTHRPTGGFCYGFYSHGRRPSGKGERYRATVIGPGVLPDIYWEGRAPGPYDRERDLALNEEQRTLLAGDALCRTN